MKTSSFFILSGRRHNHFPCTCTTADEPLQFTTDMFWVVSQKKKKHNSVMSHDTTTMLQVPQFVAKLCLVKFRRSATNYAINNKVVIVWYISEFMGI